MKIPYRPDLGTGSVLQISEGPGGEYQGNIVFEKDGRRFLETFPQSRIEPVADIFQRYQRGESDHPVDFFLKQLAYQIPLENSGGKLSNSRTDLLPHQILLTHQIVSARRSKGKGVTYTFDKSISFTIFVMIFPNLLLFFLLYTDSSTRLSYP